MMMASPVLSWFKDISVPNSCMFSTKRAKDINSAKGQWNRVAFVQHFNKRNRQKYYSSSQTPQAPKYQDVFGHTRLLSLLKRTKIVGITPAGMPSGCSLNIDESHAHRAFDVGIAEQHALRLAPDLQNGLLPFCNIYSLVLQTWAWSGIAWCGFCRIWKSFSSSTGAERLWHSPHHGVWSGRHFVVFQIWLWVPQWMKRNSATWCTHRSWRGNRAI